MVTELNLSLNLQSLNVSLAFLLGAGFLVAPAESALVLWLVSPCEGSPASLVTTYGTSTTNSTVLSARDNSGTLVLLLVYKTPKS